MKIDSWGDRPRCKENVSQQRRALNGASEKAVKRQNCEHA